MKTDIVIVNWNTGNYLKECVLSLIEFNNENINSIIIVDNNSTDNSLKDLPSKDFIKLIKEKKNHGFGKACNIGSKYSTEKYILFLNPDTKIFENTLKINLEFMEKPENSLIAIVGSKMVDINEKTVASCSRFPNLKRIFFIATGLSKIFKNKGMLMKDFNHENSMKVDQIIGAFFLIRRTVFDKLNGFDERFFLYMEEVDLSFRSHLLGYNSYYNANSKCFHRGGVSSEKNKEIRQTNYLKSRLIYFKKHFSYSNYLIICFLTFIELFPRIIFFLLKFSVKDLKAMVLSYYNLICWLLKTDK